MPIRTVSPSSASSKEASCRIKRPAVHVLAIILTLFDEACRDFLVSLCRWQLILGSSCLLVRFVSHPSQLNFSSFHKSLFFERCFNLSLCKAYNPTDSLLRHSKIFRDLPLRLLYVSKCSATIRCRVLINRCRLMIFFLSSNRNSLGVLIDILIDENTNIQIKAYHRCLYLSVYLCSQISISMSFSDCLLFMFHIIIEPRKMVFEDKNMRSC